MGWDEDVNVEIGTLKDEVAKYRRMADDASRDASITYAMCEHFITYFTQQHDSTEIREAVQWAYKDTGVSMECIAEFLERTGLTDPKYCTTEYNVHMTIPVMITINVESIDEDTAYEEALNELDSNGIDNYNMDYNTYDIDYSVEEC